MSCLPSVRGHDVNITYLQVLFFSSFTIVIRISFVSFVRLSMTTNRLARKKNYMVIKINKYVTHPELRSKRI